MLTKADIQKNTLDLRYQKELQKFNALLIFISTGVLSLLASAFVQPNFFPAIVSIAFFIIVGSLAYYYRVMRLHMQGILHELHQLENALPH